MRTARRLVAALALSAAMSAVTTVGAQAASPLPSPNPGGWRIGAAPAVPASAQPVGALAPTTSIQAAVALAPRDPAALAAYAQGVATPGSPDYHHYLSVREFAQRFGPTVADLDLARASLRAEGLVPDRPPPMVSRSRSPRPPRSWPPSSPPPSPVIGSEGDGRRSPIRSRPRCPATRPGSSRAWSGLIRWPS